MSAEEASPGIAAWAARFGLLAFALWSAETLGCAGDREVLVRAPMGRTEPRVDASAPFDEETDPMREPDPPEPGCTPERECVPEEAEPLVLRPPFARCPPTRGKGPVRFFSPGATREARSTDPHACCYVRFDCSTPARTPNRK